MTLQLNCFQLSWVGAKALLKRHYKTLMMALLGLLLPALANAQPESTGGGEASLVLPDLSSVNFLGMNGHNLLMIGLIFCVLGLLFGLAPPLAGTMPRQALGTTVITSPRAVPPNDGRISLGQAAMATQQDEQ